MGRKPFKVTNETKILVSTLYYEHLYSVERVSEELGLGRGIVRKVLETDFNGTRSRSEKAVWTKKYTKEEVLSSIRDFLVKETGSPSAAKYGEYAKEHRLPSLYTIAHHFGSWSNATSLINNNNNNNTYKERRMIEALQQFALDSRETTATVYYKKYAKIHDLPRLDTILKHFGDWEKALKAAGVKRKVKKQNKRKDYTDVELIEKLKVFAEKNGGTFTCYDYIRSKESPSWTTVSRRLGGGSWESAMEVAGINVSNNQEKFFSQKYSKSSVQDILKKVAEKHNGFLSKKDYLSEKDVPTIGTIAKFFGDWETALEQANIRQIPDSIIRERNFEETKKQIIERMKEHFANNNELTNSTTYRASGLKPSHATIRKYIGEWSTVLEVTGHKDLLNERLLNKSQQLKKSILEAIQSLYEGNITHVTGKRYKELHNVPPYHDIPSLFGSWKAAKEEALKDVIRQEKRTLEEEMKLARKTPNQFPIREYCGWSKDDVLASIQRLYNGNISNVTVTRYKKLRLEPSYEIILKIYGSWKTAKEEALKEVITLRVLNQKQKEIIDSIQMNIRENGTGITSNDYRKSNQNPPLSDIYNEFGSWEYAKIVALQRYENFA